MLGTRSLGTFTLDSGPGSSGPSGGAPTLAAEPILVNAGSIDPLEVRRLTAVRGYTFCPVFALYSDDELSAPLNLTGWTVAMTVGADGAAPTFTLTSGAGLVIAPFPAVVQVVLTGSQTAGVTVDRLRYVLALTDPAGFPLAPAYGLVVFQDAL